MNPYNSIPIGDNPHSDLGWYYLERLDEQQQMLATFLSPEAQHTIQSQWAEFSAWLCQNNHGVFDPVYVGIDEFIDRYFTFAPNQLQPAATAEDKAALSGVQALCNWYNSADLHDLEY